MASKTEVRFSLSQCQLPPIYHVRCSSISLFTPLPHRLLLRCRGRVPSVPHLHCGRLRRHDDAQLPLSQRNHLQPEPLHLRLVVQRRLRRGREVCSREKRPTGRGTEVGESGEAADGSVGKSVNIWTLSCQP
jgi:hypothetical protein